MVFNVLVLYNTDDKHFDEHQTVYHSYLFILVLLF